MTLLTILLGGVIGVFARFCCLSFLPMASFFTILIINAVGSFIIGYTFKLDTLWPFLAIGFCGAFTTYSTYSLDSLKFILNGQWGALTAYIIGTNVLCIFSCWLGFNVR